jgi:mycothiol maleylpyruvate isomerase-like protein
MSIHDEAMREFIATVHGLSGSAPSWCAGWSVHEVTAHVTAAAIERADLIEEHLAGQPPRPTRSWEVREPPLRALPTSALRARLVAEAARFECAVAALPDGDRLAYTGWDMNAARLRVHSHSEAALHRWDLVGDDDTGVRLLCEPWMTEHALAVFAAIPVLAEARRWVAADRAQRLRSEGQRDVLIVPGHEPRLADPSGDAIELAPHERLLMLWGRVPPRLRSGQLGRRIRPHGLMTDSVMAIMRAAGETIGG